MRNLQSLGMPSVTFSSRAIGLRPISLMNSGGRLANTSLGCRPRNAPSAHTSVSSLYPSSALRTSKRSSGISG